jgi:hypothetical protein
MTPTAPTTQIILASISTSNALSGAIYFKVFTPAASTWGTIGGNLSDQDDLQTALDAKMDIATYDVDADGVVDSAEREQFQAKNGYGTTLTKGTIVYVKTSSSSAQYPEVLKANAGTETTSSKTIGAVYEDIAPGEIGYIVTSGRVHNLDTASYSVGAKLWLATTDGGVTTTPPTYPNHTVFIGHVTRSQNNNGGVLYAIQNGYELDELHNVVIESPVDDEVLTYIAGAWKNKPGGSTGPIPAGMTWMGAFPG